MKKYTLITGGAGYIGSHFVEKISTTSERIIILDNLSHGHYETIKTLKNIHPKKGIIFKKIDLRDKKAVAKLFAEYKIETVVHFAALCSVSQSVLRPDLYFENNTVGTINLLNEMVVSGVKYFIFSSTCAVYGETKYLPVDEHHPLEPINPYGLTKMIIEKKLPWYEKSFGLKFVSLRYFNVVGVSKSGLVGYKKTEVPGMLVPDVVKAALRIQPLVLGYSDVDTKDGSPVRDYVDVKDLVDAHVRAIDYLKNKPVSEIINLGTGKGFSVKEILGITENVMGAKISYTRGKKRKGEYAEIYASYKKAKKLLGWTPQTSLETSISEMADWFRKQ